MLLPICMHLRNPRLLRLLGIISSERPAMTISPPYCTSLVTTCNLHPVLIFSCCHPHSLGQSCLSIYSALASFCSSLCSMFITMLGTVGPHIFASIAYTCPSGCCGFLTIMHVNSLAGAWHTVVTNNRPTQKRCDLSIVLFVQSLHSLGKVTAAQRARPPRRSVTQHALAQRTQPPLHHSPSVSTLPAVAWALETSLRL